MLRSQVFELQEQTAFIQDERLVSYTWLHMIDSCLKRYETGDESNFMYLQACVRMLRDSVSQLMLTHQNFFE
jgi:hypothetical protein